MISRPDERLLKVAEQIDTGAIVQARTDLGNSGNAPVTTILQAELLIYFGQLAPARQLLTKVGEELSSIAEVARFARAEGEWYFASHDFALARERFASAAYLYDLLKSRFGLAWALYGQARVARVQAQYEEASKHLLAAHDCLKLRLDNKGEYLQGLLNFNLALVRQCTGEIDEAVRLYTLALQQLRHSEGCRYFGLALVGQGTLHRMLGQYADGIPLFTEAISLFRQHQLQPDLAQSLTIFGHLLILLKRYDEAERQLTAASEISTQLQDAEGESAALTLLAELYMRRRLMSKAQQAVDQALAAAGRAGSRWHQAAALIVLGRMQLVLKEPQRSIDSLQQALHLAEQAGDKQQQAQCYVYLAESYHVFQVSKGQECITAAGLLISQQQEFWLKAEFDAVVSKYRRERVVVTEENKFMIDGNLLPEWEDAKRALEIFLLRNALKQADGNLTQAGKLLGISKVHVHTRRKQYDL